MSGAAGKYLLFDEGLMSEAVINGGQRVFDREDETRGQLLKTSSSIHQRGRIGKNIEAWRCNRTSVEPRGAGGRP